MSIGRIYTFADLTIGSEPLRGVLDPSTIESHATALFRQDPVKWRLLVSLLNRCLRNHFRGIPVTRDLKGRFFFRPKQTDQGPQDRKWKNGDDPERTVAAKKASPDGKQSFWVHQGARLAFQSLGERLFVCVDPCYVFTSDGKETLTGKVVGPLSIKWGGKERNAAIIRHIAFWARTLARGQVHISIATGAQPIVLSALPALARTNFGIEFDHLSVTSLLSQVEDELSLAASLLDEGQPTQTTHDDQEDVRDD